MGYVVLHEKGPRRTVLPVPKKVFVRALSANVIVTASNDDNSVTWSASSGKSTFSIPNGSPWPRAVSIGATTRSGEYATKRVQTAVPFPKIQAELVWNLKGRYARSVQRILECRENRACYAMRQVHVHFACCRSFSRTLMGHHQRNPMFFGERSDIWSP